VESGRPGFVLVDVRSEESWAEGHVPGALHIPHREIKAGSLPAGTLVVTYCWGPGCNGATRGALAFARLGHQVKEMIGGYEYWVREGYGVETAGGVVRRPVDPLTGPRSGLACAC
jgi:rhodanese-related sulfurtransferase